MVANRQLFTEGRIGEEEHLLSGTKHRQYIEGHAMRCPVPAAYWVERGSVLRHYLKDKP